MFFLKRVERGRAPVEVAHMAGLEGIRLRVARLADALSSQPLLIFFELGLVRRRHKLVLVAKQVVLRRSLLQQPMACS